MSIDLDELSRRWQQAWPACPPIAFLLRGFMNDRWVRFHSLPGSRRNASCKGDYEIILRRHNEILRELGAREIYLITVEYEPDDVASGTGPVNVGLHPGAVRWMRAHDPDDPERAFGLHVSRQTFEPGDLDDLLRYLADDRASHVIVADAGLRGLYHPYDGGADVIAPSGAERDRLRARYSGWLSSREDGL